MIDDKQVQKALKLIRKSGANYEYFFENISSPEWIEPLSQKGFFKDPPAVIYNKDGTISFPLWPESQYLARIASQNPRLVLDTILSIKSTDNPRIRLNYAEAALNIPPELSAELVEKEIKWIKKQNHLYFGIYADTLGKLISHLAKGNQIQSAFNLAKVLLEILPDPQAKEKAENQKRLYEPPKPTARIGDYQYEEILKRNIPDLLRAKGLETFRFLCDLLEKTMRYLTRELDFNDYSNLWRPTIDESDHIIYHDYWDHLVSAVRDAAKFLVAEKIEGLANVINELKNRNFLVYKRISLHLLRQFSEDAKEIIIQNLTDFQVFNNDHLQPEYTLLMKNCFNKLDFKYQKIILDWMGKAPEYTGEDNPEKRRRAWQWRHLSWIRDDLPEYLKSYYGELVSEFGEPETPETPPFSVRVFYEGPFSPLKEQELLKMSVDEIVSYLKIWQPKKDRRSPSPEGLGRVLSKIIYEKPQDFAIEALKFKETDKTYVRHLLDGLSTAIKNKRPFSWDNVIPLCQWVIEQPYDPQEKENMDFENDKGWKWTRKTIAGLLQNGLQADNGSIPYEFRSDIWNILLPLTKDPDPTPEIDNDPSWDHFTHAINSIRGDAIIAVILYALWVRKYIIESKNITIKEFCGSEEIPEAMAVLNKHLDINYDASLAIRSIYGHFFTNLTLIDYKWAKDRKDQIFKIPSDRPTFGIVAWETFIATNRAYSEIFDILEEQYNLAVDNLGKKSKERYELRDPDISLAEHLIILYGYGSLDFKEPGSILVRFWSSAKQDLKNHIIDFIGRGLYSTQGTLDSHFTERTIAAWNKFTDEAQNSKKQEDYREGAANFGWWFISQKFEPEWSLNQLQKAIKIARKIEPVHLVAEQLVKYANEYLMMTLQCLKELITESSEIWDIYGYQKEARELLIKGLSSGDNVVYSLAKEIVDVLLSKGFREIRDLIKDNVFCSG